MTSVYDWTDDLDKAIERLHHNRNTPRFLIDATVKVNDDLRLALISAKTIFGAKVSNEIVLAIYDRVEAQRISLLKKDIASNGVELNSLTKEQALSALKDCWLRLHPQHLENEYFEAVSGFEVLLGV